mgnify:FL=1
MTAFIAERVCEAEDNAGQKIQISIAIEAPYKIDEESWGCIVSIEGLKLRTTQNKPHRIVGSDSWQALTLAITLIEQLLFYFVESGGKLFWDGGSEPMRIHDVIPRFPQNAT